MTSLYNDSSIKWNVLFGNHNFQIIVFQLIHFKWGLNVSVADKTDVGIWTQRLFLSRQKGLPLCLFVCFFTFIHVIDEKTISHV